MKQRYGFRSNEVYNEWGEHSLPEVMDHEINELENKDILDTLGVETFEEAIAKVKKFYQREDLSELRCVWLAANPEDVYEMYTDKTKDSWSTIYDIEVQPTFMLLSDIGKEGCLFGYEEV